MKSTERLTRHNILLFEGDLERLRDFYLHRSPTEVIRVLLRKHLQALEQTKEVKNGRAA